MRYSALLLKKAALVTFCLLPERGLNLKGKTSFLEEILNYFKRWSSYPRLAPNIPTCLKGGAKMAELVHLKVYLFTYGNVVPRDNMVFMVNIVSVTTVLMGEYILVNSVCVIWNYQVYLLIRS